MKKMVDGVIMDMTEDEIAEFIASQHTPVIVPQSVTARQARLALLQAGLLDAVENAIATMEGDAGRAARIEWEYATEVRRNGSTLSGVQVWIGLTDQQIDDLFLLAATL